jgi:hypothetical protein
MEQQGTYWPGSGSSQGEGNGTQATPPNQKWILILGGIAVAVVLMLAMIVLFKPAPSQPSTPPPQVQTPERPKSNPDPVSIKTTPSSLELNVGDSRPIQIEIEPVDATQTYRTSSSDPSVMEWSDGFIRGLAPGQATLLIVSEAAPLVSGQVVITVKGAVSQPPSTVKPVSSKQPEVSKPVVTTPPAAEEPKGSSSTAPPTTTQVSIITAPPFAEVFLDGRFLGNTPLKNQSVPVGRHRLQVSHRRFKAVDTVLNLRSKEVTLRFRLFGE